MKTHFSWDKDSTLKLVQLATFIIIGAVLSMSTIYWISFPEKSGQLGKYIPLFIGLAVVYSAGMYPKFKQ